MNDTAQTPEQPQNAEQPKDTTTILAMKDQAAHQALSNEPASKLPVFLRDFQVASFDHYLVAGIATVLLLFGGLGTWSAVASISGAVIANGSITVEGKPQTIQHLDGGIIGEIHVRDGDSVNAGDILIKLDDTLLSSNLAIVQNRLYEAMILKDRLEAERDNAKSIQLSPELAIAAKQPDIIRAIEGQQKLFEARRAIQEGQVNQLNRRIVQSRDQIDGLEALKQSKVEQIGLVNEELSGLKSLQQRGLASNSRVLTLEREASKLQGEIAGYDSEIARINNVISETEIEILQGTRDFQEKVLDELKNTTAQIIEFAEQRNAALEKLKRVDIRSPVTGLVHGMNVHTVGGVISPASPIMQIIPSHDRLIVEARVEPQSIDQLYIGQPAKVVLSAFSRRTTPDLTGTVLTISPDRIQDQKTGQSFYQVDIALSSSEIRALENVTLVPGMPVESFIKTTDRTALSYLVKPFTDQLTRAFREE
jgi:HlyD family secretion protein